MTTFFGLSALTTSYRSPRVGRAAERRYTDTIRTLCEARQHDSAQPEAGGGSPAPARTPRRAPGRKPANGGDDADPEPERRYTLSAVAHEGLTVQTADGQRARLCVVTDDGEILSGDVCAEAFKVAVAAYRQFLQGTGHLRVLSKPPDLSKR